MKNFETSTIETKKAIPDKKPTSQDTLRWDLKFDIPKFEETMTLLLDKYNLPKEIAKSVAETIAQVKFLENYKDDWKIAWETAYKVANNIVPSNLEELKVS